MILRDNRDTIRKKLEEEETWEWNFEYWSVNKRETIKMPEKLCGASKKHNYLK